MQSGFSLKNTLLAVIACGCLVCFGACNTAKALSSESSAKEKIVIQKPEVYLKHQLDYKTFSGRGDVHLVADGNSRNLNLHIAIHKNFDILASLRIMGAFEAVRAYATKDSIFELNRIKKTAYALGYQQGTALIKADVPFSALENIFTGSPLLPVSAPVVNAIKKDSFFVITQKQGKFTQKLFYDLKTQVLKKLSLKASDRDFTCTITNDNFRKIGIGQAFPFDRSIVIHNEGKVIKADLNYIAAFINRPVNTNFKIPPSYSIATSTAENKQ